MSAMALLLLQAPIIALLVGIIFSGPLFDGVSLEVGDRPIDDSKRIQYYTQLSAYKNNFTFLPPYKRFYVSFFNRTEDSLYLYSQIIDTARYDGGWDFYNSGPYRFSSALIKTNNKNAELFPIDKGNYRFIISNDSSLSVPAMLRLFKLKSDRDKKMNSFALSDSTAAINWYALSAEEKKLVWKKHILPERKKRLFDSSYIQYSVFGKNSFLSFADHLFEYDYFEPIKKYYYASDSAEYGWYDINSPKKELYVAKKEYQEKSLTSLYLFFVVVISFIWIGMTNSVKDVVLERPVFIRERFSHLNLFTYISSKFLALLIISIFQIASFLFILWLFVPSLPIDLLNLVIILLFTTMISVGIGLIISSLANHIEFAISLLPIVLIPQLLLAGVFKHIGAMGGFLKTLSAFMVSRWSVESSVNAISNRVDFESPFLNVILPFRNIIYPCYTPTIENGKEVLSGYFPFPLEMDYIILFVYLAIVFWASILILKIKHR